MPADEADSVVDKLVNDFGANYEFAVGLLGEYRRDRASVEASWRQYFDRLMGVPAEPGRAVTVSAQPAAAEPPARVATLTRSASAAPAARDAKALMVPVLLPGDIATPIRGGALRIAENMEASLSVPTATSMRGVPVRTLEENRKLLNKDRDASGAGKVSFTHLVAWAVLRALDTFPRLNDAYAELDGQPHRIQRDSVRLGIAVDVQKKDGTRTLLVPNIRDANRLDFASFLQAFDGLVARARKGAIGPDDFMGTTVSLTNPGVMGTTLSAPRLMPGQGLIVATGALDFPPEYRAMAPRTLSLLGISKVMTVTSTYDHRIIQGAESGLFLARLEELLRGDDGFYERIFDDLKVVHRPARWEIDVTPGLFGPAGSDEVIEKQASVLQLIHAYRVRGHLVADLDPLDSRRAPHRDLDPATYGLTLWDLDREFITDGLSGRDRATLREILEILRETYCRTIGVEYMYIADPERKEWLQHRMESTRNRPRLDEASRRRILEKLVEAEAFERFLHAKYIGHKRFSLEGCEATIPFLDRLLNDGAEGGVKEVVIGMAHRGRLNVLANTIGKPLAQIFSEFDGNPDPLATQGSGDVKYHLGASGEHEAPSGHGITVSVAPNPSHLEWVNPVVEGMVRARQEGVADRERGRVIPLLIHGDAAFAGQGIVAETLNLAQLEGYTTGGTIHLVINNQIGFTTSPEDARSSTYCTDVAKMVHAPVFHVNGDEPESVDHVAVIALEYRQKFKRDVVIDLVGYRRWGHNETDEPSYTQPLMYAKIKDHTPVAELYGEHLVRTGVLTREELERLSSQKKAQMQDEGQAGFIPAVTRREPLDLAPVDATAMWGRLRAVLQALSTVPEGFAPHPKLSPWLKRRAELLEGRGDVDWATAEALAFGTLLLEGIPVRLSGQDSGRGTFSQRHSILYDVRNEKAIVPLQRLAPAGVRFEVYDSLLSEAAVMGFEFGYTVSDHRTLVLWEAQFGDFNNAAQVIVDQFLAASEQKWGQPSGLTLLLPHGYEGQGPEHSSARPERFLTLCAEENMRVCYPSTPASYFHLLRAQGRSADERPLIVLTPKSLLRHPRCVSPPGELADGRFQEVLDDPAAERTHVRRVVVTSGKLYYDLLKAREDRRSDGVALVRLEQLYPFPTEGLGRLLERYPRSAELVFAQEEPSNMGAWRFVRERFLDEGVSGAGGRTPRYVGRPPSASPAAGSYKQHLQEQDAILEAALGVGSAAGVAPAAQPAPATS
ncbi:MAG TPA: multifunctional oxoglutarate decarboxylase/oxoglutarate dehydrogenase thiamine pyrophosphate-binding subunit/dihydrolipoyllysine-residue succinyltransferase subunit [Vicinamibacteria bacterium]|nr:multifunctional oxoglutarate decarboxylase/oxoglutarate dehydrogenase thiamine pyrophosphate-binding subunit/dihydrolipoyllysine-residue succinyltransferase subunit [Vicinamibacteria bacterium]